MFVSILAALAVGAQLPPATDEERLAVLGLPSIAAEAQTGAEIYRVRLINGYGQPLPSVAFTKRNGQSPTLEVHGRSGARLHTGVNDEVWSRVPVGSANADRERAPLGSRPLPEEMCLHPWFVNVEMANNVVPGRGRKDVRSASSATGSENYTTRYGFELVALAIESDAPCQSIIVAGDAVDALIWCVRFQGARMVAASLFNQIHRTTERAAVELRTSSAWKAFMGPKSQPVVDWLGEVVRAEPLDDRVSTFVWDKMLSSQLSLYPEVYSAASSDEAMVTGAIMLGGKKLAYTQTWILDSALNKWNLKSWTVSEAADEN